MTCDEIRIRVSDLIDGGASETDRAAAELHLRDCARCAALLRRARFVVEALADLAEPAPGHLADRVLARVPRPARTASHARPASRWGDIRRVAGWGLVLLGLGWQLGGGALAAQAMTEAAPVIADARQAVARTRQAGVTAELRRAEAGVSGLARGVRSARLILNPPDDGRPMTEDSPR